TSSAGHGRRRSRTARKPGGWGNGSVTSSGCTWRKPPRGGAIPPPGVQPGGGVCLEKGASLPDRWGPTSGWPWGASYLAACLLALGEPDGVPALCYEAIRVAQEIGDQYPYTLAQRTLAEALFVLDPAHPQAATRAMLEAIQLQQALGAKPELSRSYV